MVCPLKEEISMLDQRERGNSMSDESPWLLNPVGRREAGSQPIAPRLDGLEGKTVGLLDNTKHNADLLLHEIGEQLKRQFGVKEVIYRRKVASSPGAPEAMLDELVSTCDAVVNAYGDCGSCTSWCVHDSVELEKRGVPTATVNTDEFVVLGQSEAIALGLPGLPIVVVKHPIGDVSEPEVRARAAAAMDEVGKVLVTDPAALEAEYRNRYIAESDKYRDGGLACPI
jgi:hypothetical protein